jgi:HK97 family phage prohead protease
MLTIEQLIESINSRKAVSAYGISTAAAYVKGISPCFEGSNLCPAKLFKLASPDLWAKELTDAASRLTYCNADMADPDFLSKSVRDGAGITAGSVLEYDCILSSKSKDRDGDVVHQKGGLEVDLKMPLLWQHIQVSPIGKHVALLDQDDTITKSRFAIADTELGRDAAVLVKFGALRKSIGFKPFDFSPIEIVKGADGRDVVKGWDIKKAKCMEGSLVSIPANPDTAILATYAKEFDGLATAFSRGELKHELVKHWAKGIYDLRPAQVRGADLVSKDAVPGETKATLIIGGAKLELSSLVATKMANDDVEGDTKKCPGCGKQHVAGKSCPHCAGSKSHEPSGAVGQAAKGEKCPKCSGGKLDSTGSCPECGYVRGSSGKSIGDTFKSMADLSTKLYGNEYLDGSFEKVQSGLRRTASDYLRGKGKDAAGGSHYAELLATFPNTAIVCLYSYGAVKSPCYRMSYSVDEEGNATWSGDPEEVEVKQTIIEKRFAADSLESLSRKLAAKMLTADGVNAGVDAAHETVSKAFATLKQSRESFSLEDLLN